jgi:hypothetical protein
LGSFFHWEKWVRISTGVVSYDALSGTATFSGGPQAYACGFAFALPVRIAANHHSPLTE